MSNKLYTVVKINDQLEICFRYQPHLKPMTHKQAVTFKSKMMKPSDWMLEEIKQ